jgi:hypothetical protein
MTEETITPDETSTNGDKVDETSTPVTFDSWIKTQDESTQTLISDNISGLKSALNSERSERKQLAKQVKELLSKVDAGSETQKQLETISNQMTQAEQKAEFFERASTQDITGSNLTLAWIATKEGLLNQFTRRDGEIDYDSLFNEIKETYPNLFSKAAPGHAGSGTTQSAPAKRTMNDLILEAAGRK